MRLLVIGAGMMGTAAAYDMARAPEVESVTLADNDQKRAKKAAAQVNKLSGTKKARATCLDATSERKSGSLMSEHDGALSAVPYFYNLGLAKAAIKAGCHFADLGGNNRVVEQEFGLSRKAEKAGVALAPDCGLSPGMASILAGALLQRIGGRAEALKIYVGGLPQSPKPPFNYQLVFSVEGLINEYAEPAKILRNGKVRLIEPLTEIEEFEIEDMPILEAFHTSGGTSTLPETFAGKVGECFEKTLRYPGHCAFIRGLYDLGLFSTEKRKIGGVEVSPRAVIADVMCEKFQGDQADITILRVEAHEPRGRGFLGRSKDEPRRAIAFTLVDRYNAKTKMTSMMRTTALPASIVLQMMVSGMIKKRGALRQEGDVPAAEFVKEMAQRGIHIRYDSQLIA